MRILASSYTEKVTIGLEGSGKGISLLELNESTGELTLVSSVKAQNPGFVALNRSQRLMYTFEEKESQLHPKLLTYQLIENEFKLINELPIPGGLPCHLLFLEQQKTLIVSCYQTGSIHVFQLDSKGIPLVLTQTIQHSGKSINLVRQEGPHAHMIAYQNGYVFVPDLGIDKVMVYKLNEGNLTFEYEIELPKGGGPRHVIFHSNGDYAFVTNELSGYVSLLRWEDGQFRFIKNTSVLKAHVPGDASLSTIQLVENHLFVGIRSTNSIACLRFDQQNENLSLIEHIDTQGMTPRDFTITQDQKWLLVGNQDSHSVAVFQLENGLLRYRSRLDGIRSVCCIKEL